MFSAASAAFFEPFFSAIAAPRGVSPDRVLKRDRLHAADDLFHIDSLGKAEVAAASSDSMPYSFSAFSICLIRRSYPSNCTLMV